MSYVIYGLIALGVAVELHRGQMDLASSVFFGLLWPYLVGQEFIRWVSL